MKKLFPVLLASAVAACSTTHANIASRGVEAVNQPVLNRSTYAIDLASPGGTLPSSEAARLDGWFHSLDLGYGDSIFVDGAYSDTARAQVVDIAGNYGMMVLPAAPVTEGPVPAGAVRVIVSRTRAEVPGCPNWSEPSQPTFENHSMSNFGCGVNSVLAAMVADPGLTPDKVAEFGQKSPMGRPAQPEELAPAYVFLASDADSSYITGIVLNVMGGETTGA